MKRFRICRNLVKLGLSAAAIVALTAVGGAPARAQAEHVSLTVPAVSVLFLARYVAEDAHLWEKQGLDVKTSVIIGVGAVNALVANSVDFAMSAAPSMTRADAHGQKLIALATVIEQSGQDVVIRKDIAVAAHFDPNAPLATRARVLKGRTIAIQGVGALPDIVVRIVAKSAGVTPDQMVLTPMQPPEILAAFARHEIDGFSTSPPTIQQVVLNGTGVIVSDSTKGEPTEFSPVLPDALMTRAEFCPAHRPICEKMVRGVVEAIQIIRNQPSEALAIMKAHFGTYDDKVLSAAYDMVRAITPDSPVTTAKQLENGDLMNVAVGFMKPEDMLPDYGAIIDKEFIK